MSRQPLEFEYYYRTNKCEADTARDKGCICWHAEGTGPRKDQKHTDAVPLVEWRIKEERK